MESRAVDADVFITHHGRRATTLRGERAAGFLSDVEHEDPQGLMARLTGTYERGNEGTAETTRATADLARSTALCLPIALPQK